MKLYKLTNGIGVWYVIASDTQTAIDELERVLNKKDYGFSDRRKVKELEILTTEITDDVFSLSSGARLLLTQQNPQQ